MTICGIYKITNPKGKIYIGQSVDIYRRFSTYKYSLGKNQAKLRGSFLKYGYENHNFEIIHTCEQKELNGLEIYYIDLYQTFNTSFGLNLKEGGGRDGRLSEETKQRMSISKKGKIPSQEVRRKMSLSASNRPPISEETRQKKRDTFKGRLMNEDWRKKLSESAKKRKPFTHEHIENLRKSHLGKTFMTQETKDKCSALFKGVPRSEDVRAKMKEAWIIRKLKQA